MKAFDVTLLTCERFPELTPDDQMLRDALRARGAAVRIAVWNDPAVDWSRSTVTAFRSTWDYFYHFDEFGRWLALVESQTRLVNAPSLVRWNMHKHYLRDLSERGIPTVPTIFADRGSNLDVRAACGERGWRHVVIKPCVAGSSFGARRFDLQSDVAGAQQFLNDASVRDSIVQPYLEEVETQRERSLIFFCGDYSHAIQKAPFSGGVTVGEALEKPHVALAEEIALGRAAIETLDEMPLYARVDLVPTAHGPVLMELELIEPALFFENEPSAAGRLAEILGKASSPRSRDRARV